MEKEIKGATITLPIRQEVLERFKEFLKKEIKEKCIEKGVSEFGSTSINLDSIEGLITLLSTLDNLEK